MGVPTPGGPASTPSPADRTRGWHTHRLPDSRRSHIEPAHTQPEVQQPRPHALRQHRTGFASPAARPQQHHADRDKQQAHQPARQANSQRRHRPKHRVLHQPMRVQMRPERTSGVQSVRSATGSSSRESFAGGSPTPDRADCSAAVVIRLRRRVPNRHPDQVRDRLHPSGCASGSHGPPHSPWRPSCSTRLISYCCTTSRAADLFADDLDRAPDPARGVLALPTASRSRGRLPPVPQVVLHVEHPRRDDRPPHRRSHPAEHQTKREDEPPRRPLLRALSATPPRTRWPPDRSRRRSSRTASPRKPAGTPPAPARRP